MLFKCYAKNLAEHLPLLSKPFHCILSLAATGKMHGSMLQSLSYFLMPNQSYLSNTLSLPQSVIIVGFPHHVALPLAPVHDKQYDGIVPVLCMEQHHKQPSSEGSSL